MAVNGHRVAILILERSLTIDMYHFGYSRHRAYTQATIRVATSCLQKNWMVRAREQGRRPWLLLGPW